MLVVIGQAADVLFPPALLGRVLAQLKQVPRATRTADLVIVEQPLDFPRLQAQSWPARTG
jgi:hypothetical protein